MKEQKVKGYEDIRLGNRDKLRIVLPQGGWKWPLDQQSHCLLTFALDVWSLVMMGHNLKLSGTGMYAS